MKNNNISKENVAKSFQETVIEVLYDKVSKVIEDKKVKTVLVAGGVSANKRLREKFENLKGKVENIYFPKLEYCTDNAAMIAAAAYYNLKKEKNLKNMYEIDAKSTKEI